MRFSAVPLSLSVVCLSSCAAHAQSQVVYSNSLRNNWQNWGWAKTLDLSNKTNVHGGASAIRVGAGSWEAVQLHHTPLDVSPFGALAFWISGGAGGGQKLVVKASLSDKTQSAGFALDPLQSNRWKRVVVPLEALGIAGKTDVTGLLIQNNSADAAPDFFLDDIELLSPGDAKVAFAATTVAVAATTVAVAVPVVAAPALLRVAPVEVQIDASATRHPISPLIYGVNFADASHALLRPTLNRWGGNSTTLYNWQENVDNKGNDYFFESIPQGDNSQPGAAADAFIGVSRAIGAAPMISVPITGWVAKVGPNRGKLASYSVAKYGAQQKTDQWMPDAGNGTKADGTPVEGSDPNDANKPVTPAFQAAWIKHLVSKWGAARAGGVRYYILDNEPALWSNTHRDVVPQAPTAAQLRDAIITYARAIKAADAGALVVGTEEWGWTGFKYSPADTQRASQTHNWNEANMSDRRLMNGQDFQPWLLGQIRAEEKRSGQKLLDVFSVHFYPQAPGIGLGDTDQSLQTEQLRNRSTRALWDPSYKDESWISDKVALIPRMKAWVAQNAPGTPIAITEYNWGSENSINGATTQADILGIFGREGLDLATRWVAPPAGSPTFKAMQMYRNYDGQGSGFGDTSLSTAVPNPDTLAAFGALRSKDGALTAMVVHKEPGEVAPLRLRLSHFTPGQTAQHFQLTGDNKITRLPDVPVKNGLLSVDLAPQSVNLFVVPRG